MNSRFKEEEEIVSKLLDGIAISLQNSSQVSSFDLEYFNNIKLQKLLFLAIRKFDLPVTHSWYLAGAMTPVDNANIENLRESANSIEENQIRISKEPNRDIRHIPRSRLDGNRIFTKPKKKVSELISKRGNRNKSNYSQFFSVYLEDIWFTNTLDFLEEFYMEYAPEKYRELYTLNIRFRKLLDTIKSDIEEEGEQSVQASLNKLEADVPSIPERHKDLESVLFGIRIELANNSELHETTETWDDFAALLTTAYGNILSENANFTRGECSEFLEEIDEFYYNTAWKHPCLIISKNTAKGPSQNELISHCNKELKTFEDHFERELSSVRSKALAVGLLENDS